MSASSSSSTGPTGPADSGSDYLGLERHQVAWILGGLCAGAATIISFYQMYLHYKYSKINRLRNSMLWVLGMVPVYSVAAWWGLYQKSRTEYWDLVRESYEALVIYAFFRFLLGFLGGKKNLIHLLVNRKQKHMIPFCCLPDWRMGAPFLSACTIGCLQYVPIKFTMAILTFVFSLLGWYEAGNFAADDAYPYIALITNASQIWAMYCLIMFYHALRKDLESVHPIAKFLCVKAVVFFTFWQSVGIAALVYFGYITATASYTTEQISVGLEDFIICIEMLLAAIVHIWAFPNREFSDNPPTEALKIARTNLANGIAQATQHSGLYKKSNLEFQSMDIGAANNTSQRKLENSPLSVEPVASDAMTVVPPDNTASNATGSTALNPAQTAPVPPASLVRMGTQMSFDGEITLIPLEHGASDEAEGAYFTTIAEENEKGMQSVVAEKSEPADAPQSSD